MKFLILLGPSCTEFVFPGFLHFDNGATSKIDDVLTELVGLPHVLPRAFHLRFLSCSDWSS